MNTYEIRQERRRERLEAAAEKARQRSEAAFSASHRATAGIEFGQPILVGHHSEGRHRRAVQRSWDAMGRGVKESKLAEKLEARAASVGTAGISSDDPDALAKLKEKLAGLQKAHNMMTAFNKAMRADDMPGMLAAVGTEARVRVLLQPDFAARRGFADYSLSNNRANIKRIEQRIEQLEKSRAAAPLDIQHAHFREVHNPEANRVQLFFNGKPVADTRAQLKYNGFRWAPSEGAWQRHLNAAGIYAARRVREYLEGCING